MGRKKVEINWEKLDGMLAVGTRKKTCCMILDVSEDAIERRLREKHDMTFTEYAEVKLQDTVYYLKRKAIHMALEKNNVAMLIFSLKNLGNWTDSPKDLKQMKESIELIYNTVHERNEKKDRPTQASE
jgi:hypothetical protein